MRNIIITVAISISLILVLGILLYPIYTNYDMSDLNEDLEFLDENWTDTVKRPYDIHGLDDVKECMITDTENVTRKCK